MEMLVVVVVAWHGTFAAGGTFVVVAVAIMIGERVTPSAADTRPWMQGKLVHSWKYFELHQRKG